jgi:hypothetical protein
VEEDGIVQSHEQNLHPIAKGCKPSSSQVRIGNKRGVDLS